ncbi:syndecan-4 isoform X2 [Festucalex cinctus]
MSPFGSPANLLAFGLLLIFSTWCSRVASESVRETETWMPLGVAATHRHERQESSGDFGFTDDDDDEDEEDREDNYNYDDWYYDDEDEYDEDDRDETSGSGDEAEADRSSPGRDWPPPTQHPEADNRIPEWAGPSRPAVVRDQEPEAPPNDNEIPLRKGPHSAEPLPSNVLMSHADDGILARTDILAALICGGGMCLILAVVLVVVLLHRMKKKDEGSYELVKKPIYTKTPTAEIYA